MAADPITHTLAYTLAHLARLDVLIRHEVMRVREARPRQAADAFLGLYISEEDVDPLLARPLEPTGERGMGESSDGLAAALHAADARIAALERTASERGELLRLDHLGRTFGLSAFERQVVIVALAAELDLKYERLFGYLQDDVTKKRPSVDLVLRLLCRSWPEAVAARTVFDPGAPLFRWELMSLHEDPASQHAVLLARYIKLDDRIAAYLLGADAIDPRLAPLSVALPADTGGLADGARNRLGLWAGAWREARPPSLAAAGDARQRVDPERTEPVVLVHGRYGTGRRAAAAHLASALGRDWLLLDAGDRFGEGELPRVLRIAEREARLTGALLCWYRVDRLLQPDPERRADQAAFLQALAQGRAPTVLLSERAWEPSRTLDRRPFFRFELPETSYAERRLRWAAGLNGEAAGLGDHALGELAGRFRLTAGQIDDALARARTLAWARDLADGRVTLSDIDAACRTQAQHSLDTLARKLTPRYDWGDIVLPAHELATLRLISSMIRQRPVVYGDWGFDRKLAMGKGVMALFAGPSGTGKTMAAEIIARDLGLDVYKINLSAVVNKYIGETEKNLERMFTEAQNSEAILFFDEADALFGKRSGVSDAHDRYANIETAYLLQRTEEYDGLVILASNLPKNMDEAFTRRLHFSVTFREPEEAERLEIWRRTFPPEAPRAPNLDLALLARQFKITGGNIRNIVLAAAFLAAEAGEPIDMRHLMAATGQELRKLGKVLHDGERGAYARPLPR